MEDVNDFTQGVMGKNIMKLAVPMMMAQLVNVLYNVVDRIYIARIPGTGTVALIGLGVALPVTLCVSAFTQLFGAGGAPLCSIARGRGDHKTAEEIMGNSFVLLIIAGLILTVVGLIVKRPVLFLFGASDATIDYADEYAGIYLLGSIFVMLGLGMNPYINSQGFGRIGMLTVIIGAVTNIILDPIFIFGLNMGVKGAALATVLAQGVSSYWVLHFLKSKKAILRLEYHALGLNPVHIKNIIMLGISGFVTALTSSLVQIVNNKTLEQYGGDMYIASMTIINSIREIFSLPIYGLMQGAQPVLGYNYGAREYKRVKQGIVFITIVGTIYTCVAVGLTNLFPRFFIGLFTEDINVLTLTIPCLRIYFFGFYMISFHFAGQTVFLSLGKSKKAAFFSMLRKIGIVIPMTLILPIWFGTKGVFAAEPISSFIGGIACFTTMMLTVWRELCRGAKQMEL